jgi:WD40 repeat protein
VAGVRNGDVEIWDIPGAALVSEESHGGPVTAVAWSADGDYVASGSTDNTIKVWRPVMGGGTTSRKFHVLSRAGPGPKDKFLPQGRPGSEIRVFETQGGPPVPMCSTSMTFTINTNYKALCVEKSGGRVEYYGVPCGSNGDQIMWLKARAIDLRVSVSPADCHWDWTKHAERAFYGGFCGIAPTVPGGSALPTRCTPAHCQAQVPALVCLWL